MYQHLRFQPQPAPKLPILTGADPLVYYSWRTEVKALFFTNRVETRPGIPAPDIHSIVVASLKDDALKWYLANTDIALAALDRKEEEFFKETHAKFLSEVPRYTVFQNLFSTPSDSDGCYVYLQLLVRVESSDQGVA